MDTMKRRLTSSEAEFLYPIFRSTLPYRRIVCDINSGNVGGQRNSITPTGNPFFSVHVYCNDFAADSVPFDSKWVFVHELTHVWQYYHQVNLVFSAIGLFVSNIKCGYGAAYPYDLKSSKDLSGFNIEQQASDRCRLLGDDAGIEDRDTTLTASQGSRTTFHTSISSDGPGRRTYLRCAITMGYSKVTPDLETGTPPRVFNHLRISRRFDKYSAPSLATAG